MAKPHIPAFVFSSSRLFAAVGLLTACGASATAGNHDGGAFGDGSAAAHAFRKITLSTEFTCEGATFGDFNRDGLRDVVAGPFWYEGPAFTTRHQLYAPRSFDPKGYSDCFFMFVLDFNDDDWDDVLLLGFPGQAAWWLENPGNAAPVTPAGPDWQRHLVASVVDNEAPAFADLNGDGAPELVFSSGGCLGWAAPEQGLAAEPWTFHPLSPPLGFGPFTHGLGVGDVDGDGRPDVLEATGWWRQPASLSQDPLWDRHRQSFGSGGAQMATVDVDADGDADVVTSLAAHGTGLAWYEQRQNVGASSFVQHVIVAEDEAVSTVALHEPHALAVADIDNDGLSDIVTGERFWGHVPGGDPDFGAPARLYWFQMVRDATGPATQPRDEPHYLPHLIDDASGVGTQVVIGDVTKDGLLDIVVANKKGSFVFIHELK